MGIAGLLPFLDKATRPCHISEFSGATVAVDTYCWLHKGISGCVYELFHGNETTAYVDYCLRYVKMLRSFSIKPILVFDGRNLPAKANIEKKRRESRHSAKRKVAELLHVGKTDEARILMKQAINVTPEMASMLIKECHKIDVDCIVAPYESDAQLAFFNLKGVAEFVITEDSDLILFGCTKVMYKMDLQGQGYLVQGEKIVEAMKIRPNQYSFDKFRYMCILSGCDYVDSLHGIGLKKAQKFVTLTHETNPEIFLDKIPRYLNMNHLAITQEYKENFMMADATFRHQIVFDPYKRKLVHLTDPEVCGTNPKYCKNAGETYDDETAYQVALGNLHPTTLKKLDDWSPPNTNTSSSNSIWSGICRKSAPQREKFKKPIKIFNSQNLNTEIVDLKIKDEEDNRIKKELEFYNNKSPESKTIVRKENFKAGNPDKTSPIITKNPFIRKISKFKRTIVDTDVIVKSRFFSSDIKDIKIVDTSSSSEKLDASQSGAYNEEKIDEVDSKSCDNVRSLSPEKMDNENIDEVDDRVIIIDEEDQDNCDVIILKSSTKIETASSTKRKKLSVSRLGGIKRPKSNQHTIHNFFNKIEKQC